MRVGIPELLAIDVLSVGERFWIRDRRGRECPAFVQTHGAIKVGGEQYVNLRQALLAVVGDEIWASTDRCNFERDGRRISYADLRRLALEHPDVEEPRFVESTSGRRLAYE